MSDLLAAALLHAIRARQLKADVMCQYQMVCGILSWTVPARQDCACSPFNFCSCDCHAVTVTWHVLISLLSMLLMCLAGYM